MAADSKKTPAPAPARPSTQGVPWGAWRTFGQPPAPAAPAKKSGFGTLATVALAVGFGAISCYMLDLHSHTCESCGRKWRHFGAFNLGDEESHTCTSCGQVQWWKGGKPHVMHGAQWAVPPAPTQDQIAAQSQPFVPEEFDLKTFDPFAPPPAPQFQPPPQQQYAPQPQYMQQPYAQQPQFAPQPQYVQQPQYIAQPQPSPSRSKYMPAPQPQYVAARSTAPQSYVAQAPAGPVAPSMVHQARRYPR